MAIRVAINGFGRIGRLVFRVLENDDRFDVVAINDLANPATLAHLARVDSTHGRFAGDLKLEDGRLIVNGRAVKMLSVRNPAELPWAEEKIDWVVESTGVFRKREQLEQHLTAGAGRVLLTVPPKDAIDAVVVMGVNEEVLRPEHRIISNASCTTNCLAPIAKVLHDSFGIVSGLMTTVHAYTADQSLVDMAHSDLRRARSAATNIIPTTTGAARAVGQVMPELAGKLDGCAMRVPVVDGSIVDLTVKVSRDVTKDEVNAAMREAAAGPMKGVLAYSEEPLVSSDIIGDPHSSVFDGLSTMAMGNMVKVLSWYDNEWGYSCRVVDLMAKTSSLGGAA